MPAPDLDAVKAYMGPDHGYDDAQVQEALDAETAAQGRACRIPTDPDPWPADLAEALKRRVARNLAMRGIPLGYQAAAGDWGVSAFKVGNDAEIRRLEAPHRRLVTG